MHGMTRRDPKQSEEGEPSKTGLTDILTAIARAGYDERVNVRDIVDALGRRSLAPLLLVPALVVVSPASGMFGVSTICGLLIALIACEMMLGRRQLWLPRFVMNRAVRRTRLVRSVVTLCRPAALVDRHARRRLSVLAHPPFGYVPEVLCIALGLAMPLMEVVPFSATIAGAAVSLLAFGLVVEDGLFILTGSAIAAAAMATAITFGSAVFF